MSAFLPSQPSQRAVLAVLGPTASGKSKLALELAEAFGGEIITTDSMQVYRYLDIGTAKPDLAERRRVPHHLLDRVDPDQPYSAGMYARDAAEIIVKLHRAGRLPILCGGSGLYFRALCFGLADVPPIPASLHHTLTQRFARQGQRACRAELEKLDPLGAAELHPNDRARTERALKVLLGTGKPLHAYRAQAAVPLQGIPLLSLGLAWPREELYTRIDRRVCRMLEQGWVEEVRQVLLRGYPLDVKPLQAIGYREIGELLTAQRSPALLAEDIARRTRRYAKRQLTWFRKHPGMCWLEPQRRDELWRRVQIFLKTSA